MILISVVIPFHNDLEKLQQAVTSVCCQNLHNVPVSFEIVIGNDSRLTLSQLRASLIALVPSPYSLVITNNKYKRGPGGNRNTSIEASSGSYIAFLDADDTWEPLKTFFQYQLIAKGANLVATAYSFLESKALISPPKYLSGYKAIFYSWSPIGTSTVIVSRSLLPPKPFTSLWFCQDLVLWSQLLGSSNCRYASINIPLAQYSKDSGRTSRSSIYELLVSHYKAASLSGLIQPEAFFVTLLYLIRASKNKLIRPLCERLSVSLGNLFAHLVWPQFCARLYFYVTQSLLFDVFNGTSTFPRRKFDSEYIENNPGDIYYVAVNTDIFLDAIRRIYQYITVLGLRPSDFQFVDLGVGRGKSLLLLLREYEFNLFKYTPVGIDISKTLLHAAYSNIKHFRPNAQVKLVNLDASRCFEFVESDSLILYAYNPFGSEVLERVIQGLNRSCHVFFIYIEPANSDTLSSLGFTRIYQRTKRPLETRSREYSLFYRPPCTVEQISAN